MQAPSRWLTSTEFNHSKEQHLSTKIPGVSRAHTELLGILPQTPYPEPETLQHIVVAETARHSLIRQMYLTGQYQWGIVFGERDGGILSITHFAPNAPRFEKPDRRPFQRDTRYLLGYADSLLASHHGHVDWAGHWLVRPNSQLMTQHEELVWLKEAADQGQIDSQTPLITAGWQDGEIVINAYKFIDGDPVRLSVTD